MKNDPVMIGMSIPEDFSAPASWVQAGFRFGDKGTHTSRTIMFEELATVLHECPEEATHDDYARAIIDRNCLGKRTVATRKLSSQRLSELYGLDPSLPLFRILRYCWQADKDGHRLLALLTAMARDPLLRVTSPLILGMRPGEELVRQQMTGMLRESVGNRLNDQTLDKVVRNASSSWTQSGHLKGRGRKIRQRVNPTPVVTAYALLMGYILGVRGIGLFKTLWARVLDASTEELIQSAVDAKRLGFLDMSQSGGIIEVSFARLLTQEERRLIHGQN
ncbi:MAG: hypothetical protein AB1374_13265 [Bacillota bacterium]